MDAFYVSVEILDRPELKGKAVVVGADPRGGRGRGVVMAASYEARALGVKSALPISQAYRRAPDAVYLPPRPGRYIEVSKKVMDLLRTFADRFEQVSVDEAYLDLTSAGDFAPAEAKARAIQTAVGEQLGLGCSIGVAPNKSVAKMASEAAKPGGIRVIPADRVRAFLDPMPVTRISGVGKRTEEVLAQMGIRTIGELARFPGQELVRVLGRNAVWLWGIARGIEEMPVEEREEPKSLSLEHTFDVDTDDWKEIGETLEVLVDELHRRALRQAISFRTVGIKVRFEGFVTHTRDRTLRTHVQEKEVLMQAAMELLEEFRGRRLRLLGVRVSNLLVGVASQGRLPGAPPPSAPTL